MAKVKSAPSPQLGGQALASTYVTQCKVCLLGIYLHQARVWSRRPLGFEPHGQLSMTVRQFVFFRSSMLISSSFGFAYEAGVKSEIDAVERAEYVAAQRARVVQS